MSESIKPSRREFMKNSTVVLGAATTFTIGASAHAKKNEKLKVGLIGCGGRGNGAVMQAIAADREAP